MVVGVERRGVGVGVVWRGIGVVAVLRRRIGCVLRRGAVYEAWEVLLGAGIDFDAAKAKNGVIQSNLIEKIGIDRRSMSYDTMVAAWNAKIRQDKLYDTIITSAPHESHESQDRATSHSHSYLPEFLSGGGMECVEVPGESSQQHHGRRLGCRRLVDTERYHE